MASQSSWLFIHSSDELYGADRILLLTLDALPDHVRAKARVWLPSDLTHGRFRLCERIREMGIRVDHVPLPILRRANLNPSGLAALARKSAQFRAAVKKVRPDVVYGTTSATLPALAAIAGAGPEVIFHNQEVWSQNEGQVLGALALTAHRIICVSEAAQASLPAGTRERSVVVSNTTPDPTQVHGFQELDRLASFPIEFLAAGRWSSRKGFDVLLAAWAQAGLGKLTIVGGPPPSGESVDVPELVKALPDPASVSLVDEVDSISALISESHVVLMPSKLPESFGLVALEAMAAGRPVIATNVGGLEELVDDEVGWVVPPSDASALADALRAVNSDEISRRGQRARHRYVTRYSPDRFAESWRSAVGLGYREERSTT